MKLYINFILVAFAGCSSDKVFKTANVEVQGHRGARMVLPENTLPAFQHALDVGVDTLELDLGVTKDNVLIVTHDQKINPDICKRKDKQKLDPELWVRNLTLNEIKQLDCGSQVNPRFPKQKSLPGTEIPTLSEVFQLAYGKDVKFNIEMKSSAEHPNAQPAPKVFAELLLKEIEKHGHENRVTAQSFDHRTLKEMKKLNPNIQLAALFEEEPSDWVEATKSAQADIVSPYFLHISKLDVEKIHAAGLKVIPWTANTKKEWAHLIQLGVDGIITDNPEPLLKLLGR